MSSCLTGSNIVIQPIQMGSLKLIIGIQQACSYQNASMQSREISLFKLFSAKQLLDQRRTESTSAV